MHARRFDAYDGKQCHARWQLELLGAHAKEDGAIGRDIGDGGKKCDSGVVRIEKAQIFGALPGPQHEFREMECGSARMRLARSQKAHCCYERKGAETERHGRESDCSAKVDCARVSRERDRLYFNGSLGTSAAVLSVTSSYLPTQGASGALQYTITNLVAKQQAEVSILDAYTGNGSIRLLKHNQTLEDVVSLDKFYGWYDLIITVSGDATFNYRLAGHVENGSDSFSDPALGGLVKLKG